MNETPGVEAEAGDFVLVPDQLVYSREDEATLFQQLYDEALEAGEREESERLYRFLTNLLGKRGERVLTPERQVTCVAPLVPRSVLGDKLFGSLCESAQRLLGMFGRVVQTFLDEIGDWKFPLSAFVATALELELKARLADEIAQYEAGLKSLPWEKRYPQFWTLWDLIELAKMSGFLFSGSAHIVRDVRNQLLHEADVPTQMFNDLIAAAGFDPNNALRGGTIWHGLAALRIP